MRRLYHGTSIHPMARLTGNCLAAAKLGRFVIPIILVVSAIVLGSAGCDRNCSVTGDEKVLIGGDFSLTDHRGNPVSNAQYRGRYMLVVFGFTSCPDVCPTELQNISTAFDLLGPSAIAIKPIFITIDPDRDDVATLAAYMENFYPGIDGLTGTPTQIEQAARAYRVYYAKSRDSDDDPYYTMDHSTFIYLMDCEGRYIRHFQPNVTPKALAATLGKLI